MRKTLVTVMAALVVCLTACGRRTHLDEANGVQFSTPRSWDLVASAGEGFAFNLPDLGAGCTCAVRVFREKRSEAAFITGLQGVIAKTPGVKKLHEGQVGHMLGAGWKWKDAAGVHVRYTLWKAVEGGVLVVEMDGVAGEESLWGELDTQMFRAGQSVRFKE